MSKLPKNPTTWIFGLGLAGVAVSFMMAIITAVQGEKAKVPVDPSTIPVPALDG